MKSIWQNGINNYNKQPNVKPITIDNVVDMYNRRTQFDKKNGDADAYFKEYTLERTW